jgi:serine O-acetyltransferase
MGLAQLHAFAPSYQLVRRMDLVKGYSAAESGVHRDSIFPDEDQSSEALDESDAWQSSLALSSKPIISSLFDSRPEFTALVESLQTPSGMKLLWAQVKLEAEHALGPEPEAGPQLYQGILSHQSLLEAVCTTVAHEICSELMPATAIKNLFLEALTPEDELTIHLDVMAVAMRSPSVGNIMTATLFHKGFHALVSYRVGHRLWECGRTGLAYFMQSTVSRKYSADIHPAARMGSGIYLNTGGGVVIGETAVLGNDVSILQGVTLGGTGKENGDRHPKIGNGVILHPGATVLGNISVGDGAVVCAKSIVTKPVPPLARVSGVPARIQSYRDVSKGEFDRSDLCRHLAFKYMDDWIRLAEGHSGVFSFHAESSKSFR